MSFDTSKDTITVNDIEYDVTEGTDNDGDTILTVTLDGKDAFPGLQGLLGYERFDASMFNPRDWSNVGTMAVSYPRYNLGDEDISRIDFSVTCPNCDGEGEIKGLAEIPGGTDTCARCGGDGDVAANPVDYFKKERGARVVLPLIVYEHSGITMSVGAVGDYAFDSQGWDTSAVGYIFDTPEALKECHDSAEWDDKQIEEWLRSEVKIYASYLEGDITWWSVSDSETDFHDGCGGYIGDHETCKHECYAQIEQAIIKRLSEIAERTYWADRDVETV